MVAPFFQYAVVHRRRFARRQRTRQPRIPPRLRRLVRSRPRREIRTLPFTHYLLHRLYGTPRRLRQLGSWRNMVHFIEPLRLPHMLRRTTSITRHRFTRIIFVLEIHLSRFQEHLGLPFSVFSRQRLRNIPDRNIHTRHLYSIYLHFFHLTPDFIEFRESKHSSEMCWGATPPLKLIQFGRKYTIIQLYIHSNTQ